MAVRGDQMRGSAARGALWLRGAVIVLLCLTSTPAFETANKARTTGDDAAVFDRSPPGLLAMPATPDGQTEQSGPATIGCAIADVKSAPWIAPVIWPKATARVPGPCKTSVTAVVDGDLQVWLDVNLVDGQTILAPYVSSARELELQYDLKLLDTASIGTSTLSQSGTVHVPAVKPKRISFLRFTPQPGGNCAIGLTLRENLVPVGRYTLECGTKSIRPG